MTRLNKTLSPEMRKRLATYVNYDVLRRASNGLEIPNGVQVPNENAIGIYRDFMGYDHVLRDLEDRGYVTDFCAAFTARSLGEVDYETEAMFISEEPGNLSMVHDYLASLQSKHNVRLTRLIKPRTVGYSGDSGLTRDGGLTRDNSLASDGGLRREDTLASDGGLTRDGGLTN